MLGNRPLLRNCSNDICCFCCNNYLMKLEYDVYGFDMSCIRKQAVMEPLVDTVDQKQIVTNCQLLKTMDISKMTPGDASFTGPFKLVAERNDYVHAVVAYFDVSFTKCHKLMGFSTGAHYDAHKFNFIRCYIHIMVLVRLFQALSESNKQDQNQGVRIGSRQCCMYLEDVLTTCEGEAIMGSTESSRC